MSDDEENSSFRSMTTRIRAPQSLMENRFAVRYILANTVKNAYEELIKEKAITKEQVAKNMGELPIVIDAMMKSIDLWSIEMMADLLWGLNLSINAIALGAGIEDDEGESNENERIH